MTTKSELYPTVKVDARLMDDGTLWIKSDKLADIGRVIVEDGKTFCKQFYQDAQPEPCEDAVSRQEVADILENADPDLYVDLFNKLPSVTPKQRTGKWVNGYCSECGEHAPFWAMASTYYESNFCPNCGAKMEGEQDG